MALSRSEQMSRIHGEDTSPERLLCAALSRRGLAFDAHARTPVGRPDVVIPATQVAVFIDGCFWHGCPEHYVRPRTRREFWSAKLVENTTRDRRQTAALELQGWRVVRAWEHEVFVSLEEVVGRVVVAAQGGLGAPEDSWRVFRVDVLDADTDLERRHLVTLRDPQREMVVDAKRTTTKWKVPSPAAPRGSRRKPVVRLSPHNSEE
jgi:DNA mismatch endonuclease (patch repair protein)